MDIINYFNLLSLKEIADIVITQNAKCDFCNRKYVNEDIRCYEHSGGIYVEGYLKRQWVYFNCPRCDCDRSLNKILRQIMRGKR